MAQGPLLIALKKQLFKALVKPMGDSLMEILAPRIHRPLHDHLAPGIPAALREDLGIVVSGKVSQGLSRALGDSLTHTVSQNLIHSLPRPVFERTLVALVRTLTRSLTLSISATVVRTLHSAALASHPACFACLSQRANCNMCPAGAMQALNEQLQDVAFYGNRFGAHFGDKFANATLLSIAELAKKE